MFPKSNYEPHEIELEYMRDSDNVLHKIERLRESKKIKACRRSGAKFPVRVFQEFTTDRGNRYFTITSFNSRADVFSKHQAEVLVAPIFQDDGRYRAYTFAKDSHSGNDIIIEYVPHFFEQYAERMNSEKRGLSLIKEYFSRNIYVTPAHGFARPGENDAIMFTCNDGGLFGHRYKTNSFLTFVTFIASNTMQHGYKAKFDSQHDEVSRGYIDNSIFPERIKKKITYRE